MKYLQRSFSVAMPGNKVAWPFESRPSQRDDPFLFGWVVGLLEGEGCFFTRRDKRGSTVNAAIAIVMCDEEPVRKIFAFFGAGTFRGPFKQRRNQPAHHRLSYKWEVRTRQAREIMVRVLPHMSPRRRAKIEEILALPVREYRQ